MVQYGLTYTKVRNLLFLALISLNLLAAWSALLNLLENILLVTAHPQLLDRDLCGTYWDHYSPKSDDLEHNIKDLTGLTCKSNRAVACWAHLDCWISDSLSRDSPTYPLHISELALQNWDVRRHEQHLAVQSNIRYLDGMVSGITC